MGQWLTGEAQIGGDSGLVKRICDGYPGQLHSLRRGMRERKPAGKAVASGGLFIDPSWGTKGWEPLPETGSGPLYFKALIPCPRW